MLKRVKRRVDCVKEKWRRLTEIPERTTPAAQLAGVSRSEPSHAESPAANPPSLLVLSSVAPSKDGPGSDPTPVGSPPTNQNLPHASPSAISGQPDLCSAHVSIQHISPMPKPDDVQDSEPGMSSPDIKPGLKNTAWSGLKTLLGVLDASADGFGPLKSAVGELLKCIDVYEKQAIVGAEYRQLRADLNNISGEIAEYINEPALASMKDGVERLKLGIEAETKTVIQKIERNKRERFIEATEDENEVVACYRRIQGHLDRFTRTATISVLKTTNDQAARSLPELLPYASAAKYCSAESRSLGRNGCTPDTRVGVLDQLQAWANDAKGQKIYWLNGMAGTGKTTIAYSLCERLEGVGCLAASFFCSRQSPECRNVSLIIPSIAYQLSLVSRPFRYAIYEKLKKNQDVHNTQVSAQFKSLIADLLHEVRNSLPGNLVIVIDALDECSDADSVDSMLFALLQHAKDLPVRFLVTSRPDPNILDRMESGEYASARSELRLHELERAVVQSDIKTYLATELTGLKLSIADLDLLVERSGVLFVYASTVARYVKQGSFAQKRKRLNNVLTMPTPPKNGHKDIDELYNTILRAAFNEDRLDRSEREEMEQVLRTVVCAQEPLSVDSIAGLLGINDADTVRTVLGPFLSVVQISSTTGLVTTLHESFPDYLLDEERSGTAFYCDKKQHHARLTKLCFDQIKVPNPPFNICNLESSFIPDREVPDIDDRIKTVISEPLFYACRYWEAHMKLTEAPELVMNELLDFLSTRLLMWMEVLSLKQNVHNGAGMLSRLNAWLTDKHALDNLREPVLDALRFMNTCLSGPARHLTPHIYISILALWPAERAMSRYYSASMTSLALATGTAMQARDSAALATINSPSEIFCVACSPDGTYIAAGGRDNMIYIWDAHTGQMAGKPLGGHTGFISSIAYSPSGAHIASGSADRTICIWDTHTRKMIRPPLEGHASTLHSVAYSPDGMYVVSGSGDKTIRIWDAHTGRILGKPITGHMDGVNSVAYSPDGKWIVSGSDDRTVRIWDVRTRQVLGNPLEGHTQVVCSVAFSPDGRYIVSGSGDSTIHVWDAHAGQMLGQPITGHTHWIRSVAYSPNGDYIISGSYDKTICIWDSHTRTMLGQPLKGHTGYVWSVRYSPDGTRIITGSDDCTICIWDAHAGQTLGQATEGHRGGVRCVAYSPDSMHIVSGSEDKTICIWDAHTGQMVGQPLEGHEGTVNSIGYSLDGKHVVSGSEDKTIRIWDANSRKTVGEPLEGHTGTVSSVAYSPDGARIASGSWDHTIRIWDAHTGQMVGQPLEGHTVLVYSVAYSPDGMRIVSGSGDETIRIWDAQTGQMLGQPMRGHAVDITSVSYSPDGNHIISGSHDCTVRIWDAQTGETLGQPLEGHTHHVLSVAYSPDGKYIVSGSWDNTIRIWDVRTGKTLGQPLEGHTDWVYSVAYSPDGTRIVSGSWDRTIRIWDATTLQQLGDLSQTHQDSNCQDPQAPDSSILVSSGSSPGIRVYEPKTAGGFPILPLSDPNPWTLSRDGWVVSHDLKPLLWVPPELRDTLLRYGNTCLISKEGSWKLDISKAKFGKDWKECYRPSNV